MMIIKLRKIGSIRAFGCRMFAAQTAHKSEGHGHGDISPQQLKTKTLPNGLFVAAHENYSPIARVGVFINAGSRYEPLEELGLTHALRNAAGLSTMKSTVFGITRNIEFVGGRLTAVATRDHLIYILENIRDSTEKNLAFLSSTIMEPAFKPWELTDFAYRQRVDLAMLNESPQLMLMEALHKVAFRGGLSNSLFTPEYNLGKHTSEMLHKYVRNTFLSNRTAIVGLGVDHDSLLHFVERNFQLPKGEVKQMGESKFIGGEIRVDTNSDFTYVAVAAEGAGIKNQKDMIALSLFQALLGCGPRIKYSSGNASKLGAAGAKVAEYPIAVSSLNISHSDNGLFGFSVVSHAKEVHKVVKAIVSQLRDSAKSINDQELSIAKNRLKATILMAMEDHSAVLEEMGTQALVFGKIQSAGEIEKIIDSITVQDIASIASKVIKGKGAMASVGKLYNTPYLEDLV